MDQVKTKPPNRGNTHQPIQIELGIARVPIPASRRSSWKASIAAMYDYLEGLILDDQDKAGGTYEPNSGM